MKQEKQASKHTTILFLRPSHEIVQQSLGDFSMLKPKDVRILGSTIT